MNVLLLGIEIFLRVNFKLMSSSKTPFMLITEVKKTELYNLLDSLLSDFSLPERINPLLKVITFLKNEKTLKNRFDLFIRSGEVERELDDYFCKSGYSGKVHREECDWVRCVMEIIHIHSQDPFTFKSLETIILYFFKK